MLDVERRQSSFLFSSLSVLGLPLPARHHGKKKYAKMDFGGLVLVLLVAGQKKINLNRCSVPSQTQVRSGRARGEVSPQEHSKAGWSFLDSSLL